MSWIMRGLLLVLMVSMAAGRTLDSRRVRREVPKNSYIDFKLDVDEDKETTTLASSTSTTSATLTAETPVETERVDRDRVGVPGTSYIDRNKESEVPDSSTLKPAVGPVNSGHNEHDDHKIQAPETEPSLPRVTKVAGCNGNKDKKEAASPDKKEESISSEETVKKEESISSEETVKKEVSISSEETVKKEESISSEETVKKEESISSEETTKEEESISSEETIKKEESISSEKTTKKEESSSEETIKKEESISSEETTKKAKINKRSITETKTPKRPKKSNPELLNHLGLTKLKSPAVNHHRKRLASQSRKTHHQKSSADSKMFVIKLPPNPYYYAQHELNGVDVLESQPKSVNTLPVSFSSNGKPSRVYHWNIPVIKKMVARKAAVFADSDVFNIDKQATWNDAGDEKAIFRKATFYAPKKPSKQAFRKYFAGNGKPHSFYVMGKSKKPASVHRLLP